MGKLNYSQNYDIDAPIIEDLIPEKLIKVYPYELINTMKSEAFMVNNGTTIATISQLPILKNTDESLELEQESNESYFEMFAAITSVGKLDLATSTSTLGQELKEEDSFLGLSNWYYEGELEKIKLGNANFIPAIFTIGKPFDKAEYEAGDQPVFIASSMVEAKQGNAEMQDSIVNARGLYEFNFVNISSLEAAFTNARILFTKSFDTRGSNIITTDGTQNGITLGIENHTLVNFIKGRGYVEDYDKDGNTMGIQYDDIDFTTNQPMVPIKMTPVQTSEKLEMYADWFDYDVCLPYAIANAFKAGAKLDIKINGKALLTEDDRFLIEDMLMVSAGFADSWSSAPRDTGGDNAGKILPDFRVGHSAIKVQAIEGKDPIKVIDGIYETHIRKHPTFETDELRYKPVREILAALSRYIYSNYAIGKGQSAFNKIYLPWYLEPTDSLLASEEKSVNNPDFGKTDEILTYVMKSEGVTFKTLSLYFTEDFTTTVQSKPFGDLVIPKQINLSNTHVVQTDRKIALPNIIDTISPISKLPLPGDIDTKSNKDLNALWFMPLKTQKEMMELYLETLDTKQDTVVGVPVTIQLKPENKGIVKTQQQANAAMLLQQAGSIKQIPLVNNVWSQTYGGVPDEKTENILDMDGKGTINVDIRNPANYDKSRELLYRESIAAHYGWLVEAVRITKLSYDRVNYQIGVIEWQVAHSEYGPGIVIPSQVGKIEKLSWDDRRVIFDKQAWKKFLIDYKIIPNGIQNIELLETSNFKIRELSELSIASVWGNFVDLTVNGTLVARIPLFNKYDETIGIQRIIFT